MSGIQASRADFLGIFKTEQDDLFVVDWALVNFWLGFLLFLRFDLRMWWGYFLCGTTILPNFYDFGGRLLFCLLR